jgi:hypothetical protein
MRWSNGTATGSSRTRGDNPPRRRVVTGSDAALQRAGAAARHSGGELTREGKHDVMGGNTRLGMQLRSAEIYASGIAPLLQTLGHGAQYDLAVIRGADRLALGVTHVIGNLNRGWQGLVTGAPLGYRVRYRGEVRALTDAARTLSSNLSAAAWSHPSQIAAQGAALLDEARAVHRQIMQMPGFAAHTRAVPQGTDASRAAHIRAVSFVDL